MATTTDDRVRTGHVAETTPYAWPWNGVLDATRTALLVVDAPGDAGAIDDGSLRNASVVVATLRRAGGVAIRVRTRRASATRRLRRHGVGLQRRGDGWRSRRMPP